MNKSLAQSLIRSFGAEKVTINHAVSDANLLCKDQRAFFNCHWTWGCTEKSTKIPERNIFHCGKN